MTAAVAARRTLTPFERAAVGEVRRSLRDGGRELRQKRAEAAVMHVISRVALPAPLWGEHRAREVLTPGSPLSRAFCNRAVAQAVDAPADCPTCGGTGAGDDFDNACDVCLGDGRFVLPDASAQPVLAHAIVGASDCWWAVLADGRYAVAVRTPATRALLGWCENCLRWRRLVDAGCPKHLGLGIAKASFASRPGRWYRAALTLTAEHRALLDAALAHGGEHWDVLGDALEAVGQVRRGRKAPAAERLPERHEWPASWQTA